MFRERPAARQFLKFLGRILQRQSPQRTARKMRQSSAISPTKPTVKHTRWADGSMNHMERAALKALCDRTGHCIRGSVQNAHTHKRSFLGTCQVDL